MSFPSEVSPWRAERTRDGSYTLVQTELDEACHSLDGAWTEARERYALPTRLRARALAGELTTCRLLDVGTGLGWNLAAALAALEGSATRLSAVTLERDPRVWTATLALYERGCDASDPWAAAYERVLTCLRAALRAPERAAAEGIVVPGTLHRIRFLVGDAHESLEALDATWRCDAVFLDAFSPGADPEAWDAAFLASIAQRMAASSWLSTYSSSLTVRTALAAAGLRVGPGPRVGRKASGTVATPDGRPDALEPRTARKLARRLARARGAGGDQPRRSP